MPLPRFLHLTVLLAMGLTPACANRAAPDPADIADAVAGADTGLAWLGGAVEGPAAPTPTWAFVDWHGHDVQPKIITGIQGGQHIWVSVRAKNAAPKKMRIAVTMWDAASGVLVKPGTVDLVRDMVPGVDGWLELIGLPMQAFVKEPCLIRDHKLRVRLEMSDLYGVNLADEGFITPTYDGFCPAPADAGANAPDAVGD